MGSKPKTPKATPQQQAFEDAQARALSKETTEENRRRKALIRGQLGSQSLLTGLDAGLGSAPTAQAPGTSSQPKAQGSKGAQGQRTPAA